ncbi:methyl-accepting chemotaxis protein [Massilia sp. CFBP9012]|uniref:methyl-accepting chemotaxis protein n=1 Tax=Massilia sp. CFBP9012 TaxID=3096531 RepID=UPI002A69EFC3|nr:methyl-accepting chemotaxis protein [Massilia sp. CFBP9012]MDY0974835.1 methyl-accepting chemotaxis protein [Massilia sp. CFBP9012]
MKLANLNIGKRLALGYGVICAMLVVMIVMSNAMLGRINAGTDEIVHGRMPRIALTNQMQAEVNDIAIALRNMLLSSDAADHARQVDAIMTSRKAIDDILVQMSDALANPKAVELLAQMSKEATLYKTGQDAMIKHIAAGDTEAAHALLSDDLRPLLRRLKQATGEQIALQNEIANQAALEAEATYRSTSLLMWGLGGGALVLAALVAWWITRSITQPLGRALDVANTVAAGDLTSRIEVTSRDETGQLLQALKTMNESLARTVGTVRVGTDTIAVAAGQVAVGSQDLSSRTEQQASALEEAASSMEELTSTVRQNADNARQANVLADAASNVAARGGAVIAQVVGTMDAINASSSKITDIIGVIDGIAFQTNILALNAAVEAARAGEQGRGFAVVASEVRNLAQRSAAAAREIKGLIGDSSGKVADGSRLVAEAGATMVEIVDSVRRVTDIMGEISSASLEQTEGIEQINVAVAQMDEGTQQNAALVEEAAAAAAALREQSTRLAQAVSVFRIDGEQMLAASTASVDVVRAAVPAPVRPVLVASSSKPATRPAAARSKVTADAGDWEEF